MKRFESLPSDASLAHVFKRFPKGIEHLLRYHDAILRGPSELSIGERELIAAYVSTLNACAYCAGAHTVIASTFGIDESIVSALIEDVDTSPVDNKLKPLLRFARQLTLAPARIPPEAREAVPDAGWSEDALFDTISICALFNFMNRIVEGAGLETSAEARAATRDRHGKGKSDTPYTDFGRRLGLIAD